MLIMKMPRTSLYVKRFEWATEKVLKSVRIISACQRSDNTNTSSLFFSESDLFPSSGVLGGYFKNLKSRGSLAGEHTDQLREHASSTR